jgi:Ca2+-binding EF-hand superfamily protein
MGTKVSKEELVDLMVEFDFDHSGEITIDEFVQILTSNDEFEFRDVSNQKSYQKLKQSRQLNASDFMGAFGDMPVVFSKSFFKSRWI